jgi:YVTN family beta-propeller protein
MTLRNPFSGARGRVSRRAATVVAAGAAAVVLAGGGLAVAASHHGSRAAAHPAGRPARLAASSCHGPAGAAYVSDAGFDGFTAVNTANCQAIQTYNVGDPQVPGDPGDFNFSSTNEGVALHGSTLYFADTGNSTVGIINTSILDPKNFNPAETLINVGLFPQDLAVTPDGSQVWVAETGPQTSASAPSAVSVISTATDKVVARMSLRGQPSDITFSPDGARAYVATMDGLAVFSTKTMSQIALVRGFASTRTVAVSPDGSLVYVTDPTSNQLVVISASSLKIINRIQTGELPWQVLVSGNGDTVYVTDTDSNAVSVINASTDKITNTISVNGTPDTLGLTPNGQELWVGQNAAAAITVIDTATGATVGTVNLGGTEPQSADGFEPTGIVLTTTPTAGS